MSGRIDTAEALQAVIGRAMAALDLKIIDHLDRNALHWIASSPLAMVAFGGNGDVAVTLAGGPPGFATGDGATLNLPLEMLDDPALAREGAAFASLFLAPGIGETLRVNGRVAAMSGRYARIAVAECYIHCAKALIRSDFWSAVPAKTEVGEAIAFVGASRFMGLATFDGDGHADISPKGDPASSLARASGRSMWFPDRPGNRRADSFHNILANPRMAAAMLIPGMNVVAIARGAAEITTCPAQREAFAVRGKTPALVVRVDGLSLDLRRSPALDRATLWPVVAKPAGIHPARMLGEHVRLNKVPSAADTGGLDLTDPAVMQQAFDNDYIHNLY